MSNKLKAFGWVKLKMKEAVGQLPDFDAKRCKVTSDSHLSAAFNTYSLVGNLSREGFARMGERADVEESKWSEHPHRLSNKKGKIIQGKRYLKGR
jgi:hypothetical protein